MKGHSFSEPVRNIQCFVKTFWKERKYSMAEYSDRVNAVSPVNEQTAPDHDHEYGKIDPVCPSDGQRMLFPDCFHDQIIFWPPASTRIVFLSWVNETKLNGISANSLGMANEVFPDPLAVIVFNTLTMFT